METVIYMARELLGAMKPRASANEDASGEPFRAVVACGSTIIRSDVIVTVRAVRGNADLDADLRLCVGWGSCEAETTSQPPSKYKCGYAHKLLPLLDRSLFCNLFRGEPRGQLQAPRKSHRLKRVPPIFVEMKNTGVQVTTHKIPVRRPILVVSAALSKWHPGKHLATIRTCRLPWAATRLTGLIWKSPL